MRLHDMQLQMAMSLLRPLDEPVPCSEYSYMVSTPNLKAQERIRIYRESYWYRLIHSLEDDFIGLGAILGHERYHELLRRYLKDRPSRSFTLRNLGQFMEEWLSANAIFIQDDIQICLDMARLEWAAIETFDEAEQRPLSVEELATAGAESRFALQPYIRLLTLHSPIDDVHLAAKDKDAAQVDSALETARNYTGAALEIAIHRRDGSVYFRSLGNEEMRMLRALQKGATLERTIEKGFEGSPLSPEEQAKLITECFGSWAKQGWLVHAKTDSYTN